MADLYLLMNVAVEPHVGGVRAATQAARAVRGAGRQPCEVNTIIITKINTQYKKKSRTAAFVLCYHTVIYITKKQTNVMKPLYNLYAMLTRIRGRMTFVVCENRYRAALAAAPPETAVPLLSVTCRDLHFANQAQHTRCVRSTTSNTDHSCLLRSTSSSFI